MQLAKIAITQPNGGATSETFIRNDIKYLAAYAEIHNLSGGWLPPYANDVPLLPLFIAKAEKILAQVLGREFLYGFTANRIAAYLRKQKIQVVVAKYGPGGVAMQPICARLNMPLLVHFHGLDLTGDKVLNRYQNDYQRLFETAAGILVVSNNQTEILVKMGCPRHKIHYSIYGADTKWAAVQPHFEKRIFLAIGRLTAKKAPQHTIRAFAKVVEKFPDALLQMVGDGELLPACKTLIAELGLAQNVQLLGSQTPEQVAVLMHDAIAFVQHSVTGPDGDMEGSPVAIIEAGMAGLPVIATLHAGIPDIVANGETGFLVAEHDVAMMAEKMLLLASDLRLAKALGKKANARITDLFSIPVCIAREWQIIQQFL
jgi:colanic acid/amylovoran biosynthesis glycosyltransferase